VNNKKKILKYVHGYIKIVFALLLLFLLSQWLIFPSFLLRNVGKVTQLKKHHFLFCKITWNKGATPQQNKNNTHLEKEPTTRRGNARRITLSYWTNKWFRFSCPVLHHWGKKKNHHKTQINKTLPKLKNSY